jgi:transcriptional regulator with XRE-family HTH domain
MEKSLNINIIKERLAEYGLNQSNVSSELGVSREAISQWLNNKSFPRPAQVLKLGKLLNLKYSDLIKTNTTLEPQVAFRKVGSAKTKALHYKKAKEMGFALEQLIDFLPQELMIKPPELKNPTTRYEYVQSAAKLIRNKFEIDDLEIKFSEVIEIINSFNAIIIPVLLGNKNNHENAIHIFLPESQTTWLYINLDTKVFDFKFWLSHELGHILTPSLTDNKAEDFADCFAGAFLFPEERAKIKYNEIVQLNSKQNQIDSIIDTARELVISPITILKEIEKYSIEYGLKEISLGKKFFAACTNFTKQYNLVSENIFGKQKPTATEYIKESKDKFGTIFFDLLKKYHSVNKLTPGYIKSVLNIPTTDAREILAHLSDASV